MLLHALFVFCVFNTDQPKWDTWSRLFEPLLSHVPFMHTNGNHEIEQQPSGEQQSAYNHCFPVPQKGPQGVCAGSQQAAERFLVMLCLLS